MKLNDRSCVLDAFARVMGDLPYVVAKQVRNRGEDGYHTQELIEYAANNGWAVTAFERYPERANPITGEITPVHFRNGNDARFGAHVMSQCGVLLGHRTGQTVGHAVAWDDQEMLAYDGGQMYPILTKGEPNDTFFVPELFLRMDLL